MGDADEDLEAGAPVAAGSPRGQVHPEDSHGWGSGIANGPSVDEALEEALEAIRATDGDGSGAGSVKRGFDGKREVLDFCARVKSKQATPSSVIDFPYADKDGLNKRGDDRLLERMYCFRDHGSGRQGSERLVVVHVHTLVPWGARLQRQPWPWSGECLQEASSVNVRYAERTLRIDKADDGKPRSRWEFCKRYGPKEGPERWNASEEKELRVDENDGRYYTYEEFEAEYKAEAHERWERSVSIFQDEQFKFHVVPQDKSLQNDGWRNLYQKGEPQKIVWKPRQSSGCDP